MSDAEVLVSEGDESKHGDEIIGALPPWMPKADHTGNFKLLDVVGRALDRLENDVTEIDNASTVQDAETVAQLEKLAKLVQVNHKQGESKDKYRSRIIAEFQMLTSEGTIESILKNTAVILGVSTEDVQYRDHQENGVFEISIPGDSLDSTELTTNEFGTIINRQAAAGYRIESTIRGTFTYLSESDYTGPYDSGSGGYDPSQLDSDAAKGHDGLDTNDDPKENGGTYAGLIE